MRLMMTMLAAGLVLATAGCNKQAANGPEATAQATEIAWREGDVDDALAEAKESGKPVILYWGAKWCPPCNQMKTTLFKDPAFIAETKNFVPVYLDGDTQGAQRWGEHFGISGYPTVIVLRPDGSEVTRLSSASTSGKFAELLKVAAARTETTEELLARADKDVSGLSADDWHLLAGFDWRNDPKHFGDTAKAGALLNKLAAAAPDEAMKRRFGLLALVVTAEQGADGKVQLTPAQQAQLTQILPPLLTSAEETTANRQELLSAADLIVAMPDAKQRSALGGSLVAALDKVHANESLSLPDRLDTLYADITLAKADNAGKVSPAVLTKVRERVQWADNSAKDAMSRQSVIADAADLLHEAGDSAAARKLLEAELKRSDWAYYYMLDLASIAEDDGDKAGAIAWAKKAYETSHGAATRVQWGISWANAVMRLTPEDKKAVEASASAVIDEIGKNPDSYYQRTRVKVTAWGQKLKAWSDKNGGGDVLARLQAKMAGVCKQQGSEAATCGKWTTV
ncbi:MAG: thioredoxin family protein [Sphingobium sp.]|nr:thioredoxin family protein [Sphingobium sp.]